MELQLAGWRRRIDALSEGHERDAQGLQLLEQCDQVLQATPEAIKAPAHDNVHFAPTGCSDEIVRAGRRLWRTRSYV